MTTLISKPLLFLLIMATIEPCTAGIKGSWSNFPIFNESPLEVKLGVFSDANNPDLAAVVLWNDGNNNRIDAINIPPPYDGSGLSSTSLENTATLFALGDICTVGNTVVVPYIKDFNVEVARFNGSSWSTSTIPGTTTNNFDNTDCGTTQDGIFISTHDLTDGETEIFKSTNAGGSYTFYGRYASSGPFDGAIREPLATSFGDRYAMTTYQRSDGMVRTAMFNTSDTPPVFTHTNIEQLPAPNGFSFVKESAAIFNGAGISFTYNAEGNAKIADVPQSNPAMFTTLNLGAVNNNGSQYSFQGAALIAVLDENEQAMENRAVWQWHYGYDPFNTPQTATQDSNFPFMNVGGPVDGCVSRKEEGTVDLFIEAFFMASRVGSDGTDLYLHELRADPIFADGFESGDTTTWSFNCQ